MASLRNLLQMQQGGLLGMGMRTDPPGGLLRSNIMAGRASEYQPQISQPAPMPPQAPPIATARTSVPPAGVPTDPAATGGGAPPNQGNVFGRMLDSVLGSTGDPELSAEENARLRSNAMLTAGLAILADEDGGVEGIAKALLASRQHTDASRQQMVAENLARTERLAEQQRRATMAQINPADSASVLSGVQAALAAGDASGANALMSYVDQYNVMEASQQLQFRRNLVNEQGFSNDVDGWIQRAAAFTQQGLFSDAENAREIANIMQEQVAYANEGEWRDVGDKQVFFRASDPTTPVAEIDNSMSPFEQQSIRLRELELSRAIAQGASSQYVNTLQEIGKDWQSAGSDYVRIAGSIQNALTGSDTAVGDYAALFALQNVLDPNSAVMSGERESIEQLTSKLQQLKTMPERARTGRQAQTLVDEIKQELRLIGSRLENDYNERVVGRFLPVVDAAGIKHEHVSYLQNPFTRVLAF